MAHNKERDQRRKPPTNAYPNSRYNPPRPIRPSPLIISSIFDKIFRRPGKHDEFGTSVNLILVVLVVTAADGEPGFPLYGETLGVVEGEGLVVFEHVLVGFEFIA